ncbi:MAG: hypothetical protein FJX77_11740, partial [Armatimonadetes bacterium]|nr:hypothetical protein [Armatimonadota bacterium]
MSGGRLQVLLVLMPGQPAGSVLRTIPGRSRDQLSWALLNCTTPGPDAPHTSLAAVATGRRDALPAAGGELLLDGSPALRDLQARVKSAPSWRSAMSVGAFAAGRGKSVAYCSPPQGMGAGILTVLDPEGEPARGVRMISAPNLASALEEPPPADLVVMDLTSPAAGTAAAVISQRLSDWKPTPDRLVMLVWADPAARTGDTWTRLGLVGVLGLHGGPGLLTAGSTRTSGLVTVADLAPTLLEWLRLPVPAGAEGLPLRLASKEGRERLLRLA